MQTTTAPLYINNNGEIACPTHGGSYLRSEYDFAPNRSNYYTPLGTWDRIDTDFILEWVDMMGTAPKCAYCS